MANSTTVTADGVQTDFSVTFPFLDRAHVKVRLSGALQSPPAYSWLTASSIRFASPPAYGALVYISRETPLTPVTDFSDGATLDSNSLDRALRQPLYLVEDLETGDTSIEAGAILADAYAYTDNRELAIRADMALIGGGSSSATGVSLTDSGNYFSGGNVEAAMQEVGATLNGLASPSYLVCGLSSALPNERRLVQGTGISITDGGPGGDLVIASTGGGGGGSVTSVGAVPSGAGISITGSPITSTGTFTFALSANLQAWSAVVPTTKVDVSNLAGASGSTLVGFTATATAPLRTAQDKLRERISVHDYMSAADISASVSRSSYVDLYAPFVLAHAEAVSRGGAEIYIPAGRWSLSQTLVCDASSIDVIGGGGDGNHDSLFSETGTVIKWTGAAGGEMVRVQSKNTAAAETPSGGSLRNVKLDCDWVANIGLIAASVRGWTFENITVLNPRQRGVYCTVVPNGAEARDLQKCLFRHITVRAIDNASYPNAVGIELSGDLGGGLGPGGVPGANASFNVFEHCDLIYRNGTGYKLVTADNNSFHQCRAFRPTGTGIALEVHGANTAGLECNSNTFYGFSPGAGGIKLFGTTTYSVPSKNTIFYTYDIANGSPMPTVEPGASWNIHKSNGAEYQAYLVKPVIGIDDGAVDTHRAAVANESLRIYNFSSDHMRLVDGAGNNWALRVDGTTGNLEPVRNSGSGIFNIPGAAAVGGDLALNSGNRLKLQGAANLTGIRYSSPNVDIYVGASYAAGFGSNTVGFCGTTPVTRPTITGSRGLNPALASLLTALASMGLITDSTTA